MNTISFVMLWVGSSCLIIKSGNIICSHIAFFKCGKMGSWPQKVKRKWKWTTHSKCFVLYCISRTAFIVREVFFFFFLQSAGHFHAEVNVTNLAFMSVLEQYVPIWFTVNSFQTLSLPSTGSLSLLNTWIRSIFSSFHRSTSSVCFPPTLYLCPYQAVFVVDSHPALTPWTWHLIIWYEYRIFLGTKLASRLSYWALRNTVHITLSAKAQPQVMWRWSFLYELIYCICPILLSIKLSITAVLSSAQLYAA